jgi:hypothetical protein
MDNNHSKYDLIYIFTMVFHRILDFKTGWISILALFYFNSNLPSAFIKLNPSALKKSNTSLTFFN